MQASKTNKNGKPVLLLGLMGALLFNLSSLPGIGTEVVAQSTDLLSTQFLHCDIDAQVRNNGIAECADLEKNKVRGRVTIEKVQQPAAADAPSAVPTKPDEYLVTSEVECDVCEERTRRVSRTVLNLRDVAVTAEKLFAEQTRVASQESSKEKERLKRIELCLETEDGEEITKQQKILECRIGKMQELDSEQAADYYAEHIKDDVQALLQSKSPADRALAMGVLAKMGKDMNINCASRPGLQGNPQNPMLNQPALNVAMTNMRPTSSSRSDERSFIKESACDMWAFGTYNNNVQYLQLAAAQPGTDRKAIGEALRSLRAGWGTYFQHRGLAMQADPLGMFGMGDQLYGDVSENDKAMNAGLQAIVDRHKDLMQPLPAPGQATAAAAAGRLARGGLPGQPGLGAGTPSVSEPWASVPGGSPLMKPAPAAPNAPYTGAPRVGTPVGQ